MTGQAAMIEEFKVTWRLAPTIGLLAVLAPAIAHAQTNLDQGKSAAQIFAAACAECHKAPRALGNGKSNAALTDFLGEHYTTSRDQAAALASYVLGGRGSEPIGGAAQGQSKKPATERASASAEEPKPGKHQKPGKPDDGTSADIKPQRPTEADAKAKEEATPSELPGFVSPIIRPEGGQREKPAAATRNRRKEPKTPDLPQEPAAVAHVPPAVTAERPTPTPEGAPTPMPPAASATAPTDAASGENAPVPRDNIPD
jgi:cytochrome c553